MQLHILGICGTFMGSLALLAREAGFTVTGQDENVYPPMSDMLQNAGIEIISGFDPKHLPTNATIVIGNVMSRGKPIIEKILNENLNYTSGPQWLYQNILQSRHVIAIAGTHGKTTTSSMVAWILHYTGLNPGFLIGGVPRNFDFAATLGSGKLFVVEADEYDSAFFDKRSKFVHYHPRTLIINNLEYDHADIFPDLDAIKVQFHHLLRTVPSAGTVIAPAKDTNVAAVLEQGCWSAIQKFGAKDSDWCYQLVKVDGSEFIVQHQQQQATVKWQLLGEHNVQNAVAAIAAANDVGVDINKAAAALEEFTGVKRRLELKATINSIKIFDDFAHHPTAIKTTINGLKQQQQRVIVVLDFASNTMKQGVHQQTIAESLAAADEIYLYQSPQVKWDVAGTFKDTKAKIFTSLDKLKDGVSTGVKAHDNVVIMSNGSFGGFHSQLITALEQRFG